MALLNGANLQGSNLTKTFFASSDLRGANLSETDCSGAKFNGADLDGCTFKKATLRKIDFSNRDPVSYTHLRAHET